MCPLYKNIKREKYSLGRRQSTAEKFDKRNKLKKVKKMNELHQTINSGEH